MSPRSRLAKGARAAAFNTCFTSSSPREPLLFLYPSWIPYRKTSNAASSPAVAANIRKPSHQSSVPDNVDISMREELLVKQAFSLKHVKAIRDDPLHAAVEKFLDAQKEENQQILEGDGVQAVSNGVAQALSVRRVLPGYKKTPDGRLDSQSVNNTSFKRVRRVMQRRTRHLLAEEKFALVRIAYQKARMSLKNSEEPTWDPDWRAILSELSQHTQNTEKWLNKAVSISVSDHAAEQFVRGIDNHLWELSETYGCIIEMGPADLDNGGTRHDIVLSGSKTAITKTATHILRIAPQSEMELGASSLGWKGFYTTSFGYVNHDVIQASTSQVFPRFVGSNNPGVIKSTITRADKTAVPDQWTPWTFADYIASLTTTRIPNHLIRHLYRKKVRNPERKVFDVLHKLFEDPVHAPILSRTAFHMALMYSVKKNQLADMKRFLFRMDMMKIPMTTDTFNLVLRGVALKNDLHNFHFIIHLMLRRGISPNEETWTLFMSTVIDLRIKLYIFNQMKARGLVRKIRVMKKVVAQLVRYEIEASLDNDQSQDEFLEHMDSRYGERWLTLESGNKIIHRLGLRGMISRCFDFLLVMESRQPGMTDAVSVNTILKHLQEEKNLLGIIELLQKLPSSLGFVPDQRTYHIIFEMAWRYQCYNLAKLVYKYACLHSCTTRTMRRRVYESLFGTKMGAWFIRSNQPTLPYRIIFKQTAGCFITGAHHLNNHPVAIFRDKFKEEFGLGSRNKQFLPRFEILPAAGTKFSRDDTYFLKNRSMRVINWLGKERGLRRYAKLDWGIFQYFRPTIPIQDLLLEAWELDQQWKSRHKENPHEDRWKVLVVENDKQISVPLTSTAPHLPLNIEWK
jgi:hypothetical protein